MYCKLRAIYLVTQASRVSLILLLSTSVPRAEAVKPLTETISYVNAKHCAVKAETTARERTPQRYTDAVNILKSE